MPNVGPMELIVILAIALIVLGPKRLPEVGRSIGKGMREFKDSISGDKDDDEDDESPRSSAPPRPGVAETRSLTSGSCGSRRAARRIVAHARATPRTSAAG